MSRLVAVVCLLLSGVSYAQPDDPPEDIPQLRTRRPVAVIELGDSEGGRALAEQLARELNNHPDLKPIDSSLAAAVLREKFEDEDAGPITAAERARRDAEIAVINYKFPEAASDANNGLTLLHSAMPTPKVAALSAELAFLLGAAKLGQRDPEASDWFRTARAFAPAFKPDSVRFLPEFVAAFEAANKTPVPAGELGYISVGPDPGRVFIDGREVGTSPQTFDKIAPGIHVVWLVGRDRDTHARRVVVPAGKKEPAEFLPSPISDRKRILRARLELKQAPDPTARAALIQALARSPLLDVKDVVLLTEANGKVIVQTWRDSPVDFGTPGFSALRERKLDDKPVDILAPLSPPKVPVIPRKPDGEVRPPPIVDTRSWYEKPRYQIGGVVGVVLLGVAVYALATVDFYNNPVSNPGAGFRD